MEHSYRDEKCTLHAQKRALSVAGLLIKQHALDGRGGGLMTDRINSHM